MKIAKIIFSPLLLICLSAPAQNIGIGETAPASKLSVKGSLSVGSSYSTTAAPSNGAIIEGNVGIGTASPAAPLDMAGTATIGIRYLKSGSADARITVGDNSGSDWSWSCGWGAGNGGAAGDYSLVQEGVSGVRIYFQKASSNVGVNTATPAYTLDVNGTGHYASSLTVGGAITGRVSSANLTTATNYSPGAVALVSVAATSHGGTFVIVGKVEDQTTSNYLASRNIITLYRTTSSSGYTGTGSTALDTWNFWQDAGGAINESGMVTYSEQLTAGTTYYYWLVGSGDNTTTRQALTAGTRLIVYEF